jgi:hypothetical protein
MQVVIIIFLQPSSRGVYVDAPMTDSRASRHFKVKSNNSEMSCSLTRRKKISSDVFCPSKRLQNVKNNDLDGASLGKWGLKQTA